MIHEHVKKMASELIWRRQVKIKKIYRKQCRKNISEEDKKKKKKERKEGRIRE